MLASLNQLVGALYNTHHNSLNVLHLQSVVVVQRREFSQYYYFSVDVITWKKNNNSNKKENQLFHNTANYNLRGDDESSTNNRATDC